MRIIANKRDDILKRKQEYEADRAARQADYDNNLNRFRSARKSIFDDVKSNVEYYLKGVDLDLDIEVDQAFDSMMRVRISDDNDVFNKDKALAWSWSVTLTDDGTVNKESSSWSGFKAVSEENIAYLENVLEAVRILNRIDWVKMLDRELPNFSDYDLGISPSHERPPEDFDYELIQADIEEAMENGWLIQGQGYRYYNSRATVGYKVIKESSSQYIVQEVCKGDFGDESRYPSAYRINKDKFLQIIDRPIKIIKEA